MKTFKLISSLTFLSFNMLSCTNSSADKNLRDSMVSDSMKKLAQLPKDSIPKDGDVINYLDAAGKRQGHWKIVGSMQKDISFPADAVVEEGNYKDGLKEGIWTSYNPDGKMKEKCNYVNGVREK